MASWVPVRGAIWPPGYLSEVLYGPVRVLKGSIWPCTGPKRVNMASWVLYLGPYMASLGTYPGVHPSPHVCGMTLHEHAAVYRAVPGGLRPLETAMTLHPVLPGGLPEY